MIWAVTGHRLFKLGGFSTSARHTLNCFAVTTICEMRDVDPTLYMIIGMADGFDMAVAKACVLAEVKFTAAVPCDDQSKLWTHDIQAEYFELLKRATKAVVVNPGPYDHWKMQARNEWMVDGANKVLALFDGQPSGGTWNCIKYAIKEKKEVKNVWEEWKKFNA